MEERNTFIKGDAEMSDIVYLNGDFILRERALISPDDRGFIFADGVYEVIKYYNGVPFRFEDHLKRLKRSLRELKIGRVQVLVLNKLCDSLVEKNGLIKGHSGVYIQITRGVHKRIHSFPVNIEPTVYAYAFELPSAADNLENGIKVVTHDDIRWQRCDIKSVALLPNTMLFNDAVEKGAGECVMVRDGWVTEATHSSVLGVKDGVVITRPLSNLILPGITRKVILEICSAQGIPVEERKYSLQELLEMDELMIAGTGSEITPVIQVDDHPIGKKKPGRITRLLQEIFFQMVQAD